MKSRNLQYRDKSITVFGEDSYFDRLGADTLSHLERACDIAIGPGSVCVDVGANIGLTALYLANIVGPSGNVYAFEPVPATFSFLRESVSHSGLNNIRAFQVALGSSISRLRFRDRRSFSSGNSAFLQSSELNTLSPTVDVSCVTLDSFSLLNGLAKIDLVKIDVEGFETDVLEGGEFSLATFAPWVLLEFNHFCIGVNREISPMVAFRQIRSVFKTIAYYSRKDKKYILIENDEDAVNFIRGNILTSDVDDLLCTNKEGGAAEILSKQV